MTRKNDGDGFLISSAIYLMLRRAVALPCATARIENKIIYRGNLIRPAGGGLNEPCARRQGAPLGPSGGRY